MSSFDSTRLMPGRTGRSDQLSPGMRVLAVDDWENTDVCTITEVTNKPVRNIRVVDSQGTVRLLCIWQIMSTLPTPPEDAAEWADA